MKIRPRPLNSPKMYLFAILEFPTSNIFRNHRCHRYIIFYRGEEGRLPRIRRWIFAKSFTRYTRVCQNIENTSAELESVGGHHDTLLYLRRKTWQLPDRAVNSNYTIYQREIAESANYEKVAAGRIYFDTVWLRVGIKVDDFYTFPTAALARLIRLFYESE